MTTKNIVISLVAAAVVLGGAAWAISATHDAGPNGIYGDNNNLVPAGAQGKVAASSEKDGTYYVAIVSVNQNPEDTTISFDHVMYFEGAEAVAAAKSENTCASDNYEDCVATLKRGYYVRASSVPRFTAPLTASSKIVLATKMSGANADALKKETEIAAYLPIFSVEIRDGAVATLTEVTKP